MNDKPGVHCENHAIKWALIAILSLAIGVVLALSFHEQPKQHWFKCDWPSFRDSPQCEGDTPQQPAASPRNGVGTIGPGR